MDGKGGGGGAPLAADDSPGPPTGLAPSRSEGSGDSGGDGYLWFRSGTAADAKYDDAALDDSAAVRELAARLAPELERIDALLQVPEEFRADAETRPRHRRSDGGFGSDSDSDSDGLAEEESALLSSEALLRQEMELARDVSHLFSPQTRVFFERLPGDDGDDDAGSSLASPAPAAAGPRKLSWESPTAEADLDVAEHRRAVEDATPRRSPMALIPLGMSGAGGATAVVPPPPLLATASSAGSGVLLASPPHERHRRYYTNWDHLQTLGVATEQRGWYTLDLTPLLLLPAATDEAPSEDIGGRDAATTGPPPGAVREFCLAIPEARFRNLFVGLPEGAPVEPPVASPTSAAASPSSALAPPTAAPLPVRTLTLRIRPDVLCGAVMDGVHQALERLGATVLKRQGGHVQATVPATEYVPPAPEVQGNDEDDVSSPGLETTARGGAATLAYPGFFADIQLCTYKADHGHAARVLLIRVYHDSPEFDLQSPRSREESETDLDVLLASGSADAPRPPLLEAPVDAAAAYRLREACALIQRIEAPQRRPRRIDATPNSAAHLRRLVAEHLRTHYHACPSARDGAVTMPALNSQDWVVVVSCWRMVQLIWSELEDRDLTYHQLCNNWFGAFPALPTLDVHYCSQLRRLSREGMIVELLKRASELEEYAREAEYACANMIALLQPTFETYGVVAPSLPKAAPLTAYPLEYTAPQQSCPPWGQRVMSALNEIQTWTSHVNSQMDHLGESNHLDAESSKQSLEMAEKAVYLVLRAFQLQDDEEKTARLGRKNVQVIDRLAKMEEHQLISIRSLDEACLHSAKAVAAANDFASKSGITEVPLIKWSIVVGSSTGTCYVTARRIMFVTQLIPVIGGSKVSMWDLQDVDFTVQEGVVSLLNPLPTVISVSKEGEEVYSFRPSMGGTRLKSFLDIVKTTSKSLPTTPGSGEV